MDAEMDATQKITLAWAISSAIPRPQGRTGPEGNSGLTERATEAMSLANEAITKVNRQAQEVMLITGSEEVRDSVTSYLNDMVTFNPSAAHNGNPERSEQGQQLMLRLTASHALFARAAREELQIARETSGP
ncbi:hypothetical protein [Streptomyces bauhiniae]|uniref:hypothetical protein n=1 Tax=Streptomyces bauhiniae TaxID=2340725 RepID=UPI0035DA58B8